MHLVSDSLRYFVEVARTGSIAEASESLHIAASAISRHIARLEQETGTQLFDRHPRGMIPTEAGRLLADHARRTLLEEGDLLDRIRDLHESGRALITVACTEGFAEDFAPAEIARFWERHPAARVQLSVTEPDAATEAVATGTADVALTFSLAPATGVRVAYSCPEPVVALVREGHPLAARDGVSLADLQDHPLALMAGGSTLRELVDLCCAAEGIHLEPVLTSTSSSALTGWARHTDGVTLTGQLSVRHLVGAGFRTVPLTNAELRGRRLQVHTMARRALPAPVDAFVQQVVAALGDGGLG